MVKVVNSPFVKEADVERTGYFSVALAEFVLKIENN
jgi:hypothetical protein